MDSPLRRIASLSLAAAIAATATGWPAGAVTPVLAAGGPVAAWTFDDGSGAVAADAIGSIDGIVSGGATWITSGAPQGTGALSFDGVDDVVTIANDPVLEPHDDFTLTFWMRGAADSFSHPIIQKGDYGCDAPGGSWGTVATGQSAYGTAMPVSYGYGLMFNTPNLSAMNGAWHHLAMVVDDSADTTTMYLDGHASTTAWPEPDEIRYGGASLLDAALQIGGNTPDCPYTHRFAGAVDDVRLYDSALASADIWSQLPSTTTTTSVSIWIDGHAVEGSEIDAAHTDQRLVYRVHVDPYPGSQGDITWYRSKDGGPEVPFATTPLRIDDMAGYAFLYQEPGSLDPGAYTIRASWPGASVWQASSSPALPLTITKRPVTLTLTADPANDVPPGTSRLTATLKATDAPLSHELEGPIEFHDVTSGGDVHLGTASLVASDATTSKASFDLSALSAGTHTYEARFAGTTYLTAATATAAVIIGPQTSGVGMSFPYVPYLSTEPVRAEVYLNTWRIDSGLGGLPTPTGTLTIRTSPGGVAVGSVDVSGNGSYQIVMPTQAAGSHAYIAQYSGDANYKPSSSEPVLMTVAADVVNATGVGLQYTTFYPVVDKYRDSVAIRGTRVEAISVAIKIYTPTGALLRSVTIAQAPGAYSYLFTGRSSTGRLYASGKYKVVQTLTDANGTKRVVTGYVTLSPKRLYTYTKSYTKTASQYAKKTASWMAWNFTVPSATVYSKLGIYAYGSTGVPPGAFGAHSFAACSAATYRTSCVSRVGTLPANLGWAGIPAAVAGSISGRTVRVYVWAVPGGTARVSQAKITVTYGLLK